MDYTVSLYEGVVKFFIENDIDIRVIRQELKSVVLFPRSKPMYNNTDDVRIFEVKKYNIALLYLIKDSSRSLIFTDVIYLRSSVRFKVNNKWKEHSSSFLLLFNTLQFNNIEYTYSILNQYITIKSIANKIRMWYNEYMEEDDMKQYFFLKAYRDKDKNLKIDKVYCQDYYIQYLELYKAMDNNSIESVFTFDIGSNMHLIVDSEGRLKNLPVTFETICMDKKIDTIHQFKEPRSAIDYFIKTDPDYFLAGPVLVIGHVIEEDGSYENVSLTEKMADVFYSSIYSAKEIGCDFLVLKNKQYR